MGNKYQYATRTWIDETGKRHKVRGKTEQEAADKLAELKQAVKSGNHVAAGNKVTVRVWAEEWMRVYQKPRVRKAGEPKKRGTMTQKSYDMYRQKLNGYIIPEIGNKRLRDITQKDLQRILNKAGEEEMSESHVQKLRLVLNGMFEQAVRNRLLVYDPSDGLTLPAVEKNSRRSLTAYEREVILRVARRHRCGLWIRFMLGTGIRPGESAPLQVKDIDLETGTLHIYKDIESGTADTVSPPKSPASIRDVPIPAELLGELKVYLDGKDGEAYIFPQMDGKTMKTITCIQNDWRSFIRQVDLEMGAECTAHGHIYDPKDLNLDGTPKYPNPHDPSKPRNGHKVAPDLVLYCLRHTYCTDLQRAGVPLNIARYLMGHTDISTTAHIYTHSGDVEVDQARELINSYADRGKPAGQNAGQK